MPYEWDEEIPQPKPPVRKASLWVWYEDSEQPSQREATQSDIARALGVTEAQLAAFLKNPDRKCTLACYQGQANQLMGWQGQSLVNR